MKPLALFAAPFLLAAAPGVTPGPTAQGARVTIVRDDWGIAHISAPTDADAVFGMIYAQAEDDFPRIEANYLTALGRTAEAEGEGTLWRDLRARLYVSEPELKDDYGRSPPAMQRLMDAWAAGLNQFLAVHPEVKPRVLTRFEPWMALSFTEGSIGGDIERIDEAGLAAFYGQRQLAAAGIPEDREPRGSNGIAIAPAKTAAGHALLLINPHTSFYFRAEQQVTSGEGLNAYGAATWGQFFVYQGFNPRIGWMHTSSGVDNVDEFAYPVRRTNNGWAYRFGKTWRPVEARPVTLRYRQPSGAMASRTFTTWRTHRGPIVRAADGKWIGFAMMDRPVEALQQSFLRTKATDLASFMAVADRFRANSSNNTVFADAKGEIAVLAPQFMPRRSQRLDYARPVDGSDPRSDWQGFHAPAELPNTIAPATGWVFNSNDWLYSAAGAASPRPAAFPPYLDTAGQSYRTVHATRLLSGGKDWTLDSLQAAAYDSQQPAFEVLVPMLVSAWQALPASDARRARLAEPVQLLAGWDGRWSVDSTLNTVAQFWADELTKTALAQTWADRDNQFRHIERLTGEQKIAAMARALDRLDRDWGTWKVKWGEVNRFQRIDAAIDPHFADQAGSLPVGFASNRWGSLASFGAAPKPGTRRWYGTNGNSFVAVVEFGPEIHARAVDAGGESGHIGTKHFADQAKRYAEGRLRDVYFTPAQLKGHIERTYHPGQ